MNSPQNSITLQELTEQIEFHDKNLSIQVFDNGNPVLVESFCVGNVNGVGHYLSVRQAQQADHTYAPLLEFYEDDNEQIIPSSDGEYHLLECDGDIYKIKFFLAVNNLSETVK